MERELGKIKLNENMDIIVRESDWKDTVGIDIRCYMTSQKYTGPTKKGIRIPKEKINELRDILSRV